MFKKLREWLIKVLGGELSKKEVVTIAPEIKEKKFHIRKVETNLVEYDNIKMMSSKFIEQFFLDIFKNELKVHIKTKQLEDGKTQYIAYTYIVDEEEEEDIDGFVYKTEEIKNNV